MLLFICYCLYVIVYRLIFIFLVFVSKSSNGKYQLITNRHLPFEDLAPHECDRATVKY